MTEELIAKQIEVKLSESYDFLGGTNIIRLSPLKVGDRIRAKKTYKQELALEYLKKHPKARDIPDYALLLDEEELLRYTIAELSGYLISDLDKLTFADYGIIIKEMEPFFGSTTQTPLEES